MHFGHFPSVVLCGILSLLRCAQSQWGGLVVSETAFYALEVRLLCARSASFMRQKCAIFLCIKIISALLQAVLCSLGVRLGACLGKLGKLFLVFLFFPFPCSTLFLTFPTFPYILFIIIYITLFKKEKYKIYK